MFSPAAERNKELILSALRTILPETPSVLEVACGSLQHAIYFCASNPEWRWQPTDVSEQALNHGRSLADALPANVAMPTFLDVTVSPWPISSVTAVYAANLLHIAPLAVVESIFRGAASLVPRADQVIIYGPFKINGQHTAASNAEFDQNLQAQNPEWGIRNMEYVVKQGFDYGFSLSSQLPMPANNWLLHFAAAES